MVCLKLGLLFFLIFVDFVIVRVGPGYFIYVAFVARSFHHSFFELKDFCQCGDWALNAWVLLSIRSQ